MIAVGHGSMRVRLVSHFAFQLVSLTVRTDDCQKKKNNRGCNDSASKAQSNLLKQPWYSARVFGFKHREPIRSAINCQ